VQDTQLIAQEWNQVAWSNFDANLEFLRRVGFAATGLHVLEIGCGKGALLDRMRSAGHTASGIDPDAEAIGFCNKTYPGIDARVGFGDELPFADRSFDTVLSFDVFEHIADSDKHLREVRRVLRNGGRFLLQTPNKWTNIPFEVLREHKKFGHGLIKSYRALMVDHCSLHSYWQLRKRFRKHGFDVTFVDVPVVNDFFREKVRTYMGEVGSALLKVLNPDRFPMFMRTNFYAQAVLRR
jgi:SAM-dependent methyltransferase